MFASHAMSLSFPELSIPACIQFKRIVKKSKNVSMNKQIQQLLEKLDENARFVENLRKGVDFNPKDTDKIVSFYFINLI